MDKFAGLKVSCVLSLSRSLFSISVGSDTNSCSKEQVSHFILQAPSSLFDPTSISLSLFSPCTLPNSLISGIQKCLTELAKCARQIKHLYQEQIASSLLPFQLCVFSLLTPSKPLRFGMLSFRCQSHGGFTITC